MRGLCHLSQSNNIAAVRMYISLNLLSLMLL